MSFKPGMSHATGTLEKLKLEVIQQGQLWLPARWKNKIHRRVHHADHKMRQPNPSQETFM